MYVEYIIIIVNVFFHNLGQDGMLIGDGEMNLKIKVTMNRKKILSMVDGYMNVRYRYHLLEI